MDIFPTLTLTLQSSSRNWLPVRLFQRARNNEVSRRSTCFGHSRPTIAHLFPARCLIEKLEKVIPRDQESEIIGQIVATAGRPIIIHAAGGVGKSIFSTRIAEGTPKGSFTVLYDCFGNGEYRNPTHYRHWHKDALVQIANELAANGLCHPLIPGPSDPLAFLKAFIYRLKQCIVALRAQHPEALLCIVVDAGDNAQIAANESGDASSFIRDLVREYLPEEVRLVTSCRTHRQNLLDAPPLHYQSN